MFSLSRRPRRNRLDRAGWEKLHPKVLVRDRQVVLRALVARGHRLPRPTDPMPACPAWVMDPSVWGTCSGPWNLDHVKDDPMMGKKAPDDEDFLVSLCATHDERGMRAGHSWNLAHREDERAYLRDRRRERAAALAADA